ncbi:hypothetical protein MP638_003134 [Amoeboaphelidium occidentale]|nr:hypothetical protein MP638_003134 [Amoeboaphelidium occidentale]
MDASLEKKFGEIVIQKVVFTKSTLMEEAFYQEVGIMILLKSFPHFCTILGYTETPLSIVLKYYPDGSLYEWIRKNMMAKSLVLMIVKETPEALNTMHSNYLAHCNIKPQNVLVQVDNCIPSCYLTDYGITQVLPDKIIAASIFHVINLRGLSMPYAARKLSRILDQRVTLARISRNMMSTIWLVLFMRHFYRKGFGIEFLNRVST